ncbi:MAG TPA: TatD family hydrolase [Abditibacteriaceae bacterium]|jgi:TatD DNase family protein
MFFDSHCHLTSDELAADFEGVLQRAQAAQVTGFMNIGDTLQSSRVACRQCETATSLGFDSWASVGIHPQRALEWNDESLQQLRELANHPRARAIGEIGLDFVYDEKHPLYPGAPRSVQETVLREQLQLAVELNLPVVLHNREADEDLPRVIADFPNLRGVFHCFGSPLEVAKRVLDLGFYLGFTGLVTFKNAQSVRDVARFCPLDRLLIETDAPYLAPVPFRGKTNEPSYLPHVAQTIAELHNKTIEEIGEITTQNAKRLFGI